MLRQDKQEVYDYDLDLSEYLASFWNSEAVQKVREARESRNDERFASDEEFERQIINEEFRDSHDLIRSIKDKYKNTNLDDITRGRSRDARKVRIPKDMSGLFKMTGDK
jgi:hypothetical protein